MLKNILKAGMNTLEKKGRNMQALKPQYESYDTFDLICMYKNDFSDKNLAIASILRERGYKYYKGTWIEE